MYFPSTGYRVVDGEAGRQNGKMTGRAAARAHRENWSAAGRTAGGHATEMRRDRQSSWRMVAAGFLGRRGGMGEGVSISRVWDAAEQTAKTFLEGFWLPTMGRHGGEADNT